MKIVVRCTQAAGLFVAALFLGCGELAKKESPLGLIVTPPSYYTTVRARYLGEKYKENLQRLVDRVVQNSVTGKLQFANNIASVGGVGFFTHSATKSFDERYLEVMLGAPDVFEGSVDFNSKVDRLFSQYGSELLSILASDLEIYKDREVAGYGLNFSWRNILQAPSGPRVTLERAVVYVTKGDVHKFSSREVGQTELLGAAVIFALQEEGPARLVSYLPQAARGAAQPPPQRESSEKGAEAKPDMSPKIQEYDLAPQKEEKKGLPPVTKAPARDQPAKKQEEVKRQEEGSKRAEETRRQQEAKRREDDAKRAEEAKRQDEAKQRAEAKREAAAKPAEITKQEELRRQEEARKREETAKRQEEAERQEEAKRVEAARLGEMAKQEELKRRQEAKKREEEAKRAEEAKRQEEAKQQTEARRATAAKLAEMTKQEELKRQEEARKREEAAKRAVEARQQEEGKRQEEARRAEAARLAEIARQEELKRWEQESKRAEAARKKEAEELALKAKEEPFKSPLAKDSAPQTGVKSPAQKEAKIEKPETSTATLKPSLPPSAPTATPKQTGPSYVVQLSFVGKEEAKRWFDRLRQQGYSASMSVTGEGETIRLRVGNFPSHGEASRVLGKLREEEGIKGIVIEAAN